MPDRILRLPEVKSFCATSRSTIYLHISEGLFPKPIHLGVRAVGWPESEIAALTAARIRGATTDEIRALVVKLEAARRSAA